MAARRFLLDQNFPAPVMDVAAVDRSVEYVALRDFDVSLTRGGTPDWVIYLGAARDGRFTGVVTRDKSQLDELEETVALLDTDLVVVTWQRPVEDPIKEWGQLLAFMPLVLTRLAPKHQDSGAGAEAESAPGIFFLPRPHLGSDNVTTARALLGQRASREGRAFPELRDTARREMREELRRRGLERSLGGLLGH